jgi:nucleoside-diphosphate-sugar epimerase
MPAGAPQISNNVFILAMNQARYDSLPPELKKIIDANESLKPNPIDDYSKTKYIAEELIKKNLKKKKINFLIIRLPLIYGKIGLKGSLKIANNFIKKIPFVVSIRFGNKKYMLGSKNLAYFILFVNKKKKYFSNLNCKIFNIKDEYNYSTEDIFIFFSKIYKKKIFHITILNNALKLILNFFSKKLFEKYFGSYTINISKIKKTGWKAPYKFIDHF